MASPSFIPGAHFHFLTPLYEGISRPFASKAWDRLAEDATALLPKGGTAVDIGCGPGTVLRLIRERRPDLHLIGTDIDPKMIAIARRKADGRHIIFSEASADALPLPDASADIVLSSLVFHHLSKETKQATFRGVKRILKSGSRFLLCDFSLERGTILPWWVRLLARIEPEALPQLHGELIGLGRKSGAACSTLWTMYGYVSLHVFTFP